MFFNNTQMNRHNSRLDIGEHVSAAGGSVHVQSVEINGSHPPPKISQSAILENRLCLIHRICAESWVLCVCGHAPLRLEKRTSRRYLTRLIILLQASPSRSPATASPSSPPCSSCRTPAPWSPRPCPPATTPPPCSTWPAQRW